MGIANYIDHVFKALEPSPSSAATVRKPYVISQDKNEGPNAGIGTADASASPIRFWTVRFERGGGSYYDRVEAPDAWMASTVALTRNAGAVCSQVVCEITQAEYDRFTRRSP